jgi:uncharacterized protein
VNAAGRATAGIASAGAIAWVAGCSVLYRRALGRVGYVESDPATTGLTLAPEVLDVRTADGLRLLAWHLRGTLPAVVVVSGGNRGWAGDGLGIATALQRAGLHVIVHGWRGTPGCDRAPHTLGVHERRDLQAVIDAAGRRLGALPLGLLGYSLGGAVAIAVAGSDPRVRAVCTDCAFDDPRRVLGQGVWRTLRIPGAVLTAPVGAVLALRAGARFSDFRPLESVSRIPPRPLLLIHGGADTSVPPGHARRLHDAAGPGAELWIQPGVGHCGGYDADREGYVRRVSGFLVDALSR